MTIFFDTGENRFCCGCRACEQICPVNCITMFQDKEGFLYPSINRDDCIDCGRCKKACPINMMKLGFRKGHIGKTFAYAAYHKEADIVAKSTSGGIFSAVAEGFCTENHAIFGARFDESFCVTHTYSTSIDSIDQFRGSKYVQSDVGKSYTVIKQFLGEGKKVLFSGTPCQVAGLKSYLNRDYSNLLCVDILCHGVPSPKVYELYREYLEGKFSGSISGINFREKTKKGWLHPYVRVVFSNGKKLQQAYADDYYVIGYNEQLYSRPICHECPFASTHRVSDITIADFWGIEDIKPSFVNKEGVSLVLANTPNGKRMLEMLDQVIVSDRCNIEEVIPFNPRLAYPTKPSEQREQFMLDLASGMNFNELQKRYLRRRSLFKRLVSNNLSPKVKRNMKRVFTMEI